MILIAGICHILICELNQTNKLYVFKDAQTISNGKKFSEAVEKACTSKQLVAVGVNCCPPALIKPLLESVGAHRSPDISWIVYPNSGEGWDLVTG